MPKQNHICSAHNKPSATGKSGAIAFYILKDRFKCINKASVFENGKWYCKRHAPSKVAEREEKNWQTYISKIKRNDE